MAANLPDVCLKILAKLWKCKLDRFIVVISFTLRVSNREGCGGTEFSEFWKDDLFCNAQAFSSCSVIPRRSNRILTCSSSQISPFLTEFFMFLWIFFLDITLSFGLISINVRYFLFFWEMVKTKIVDPKWRRNHQKISHFAQTNSIPPFSPTPPPSLYHGVGMTVDINHGLNGLYEQKLTTPMTVEIVKENRVIISWEDVVL